MKKTCTILVLACFLLASMRSLAQHESLYKKLNRGSRAITMNNKSVSQTTPIISGFQIQPGNKLIISGQNLKGVSGLDFDGISITNFKEDSPEKITVTGVAIPSQTITLSTAIGKAVFNIVSGTSTSSLNPGITAVNSQNTINTEPENEVAAAADFTIPEVGQSDLNIIVTPTFSMSRIFYKEGIAVGGSVWGNSFGLDSIKSKLGAKILLPQSSMFAMNFNGEYIWLKNEQTASLGLGLDINLLYKKISFLDTVSRLGNNFNPFVFHPKIGATASFFNAAIQASFYYNFLCVLSENDNIKNFFSTKKNVFVYPEVNVSGVFFVDQDQKQSIKIGFNILVNNKSARILSGTSDSVIPYLRIGILSKL